MSDQPQDLFWGEVTIPEKPKRKVKKTREKYVTLNKYPCYDRIHVTTKPKPLNDDITTIKVLVEYEEEEE